MWDAIKKAAGAMWERGKDYLRHSAAIEQILASPTVDAAVYALRTYVFSLQDEADFRSFKDAVVQQHMLAQQAQANANTAWGVSTEDRIAYAEAHMLAGAPTGGMQAQQRIEALAVMYQLADQFWLEAQSARAASSAPMADPGAAAGG